MGAHLFALVIQHPWAQGAALYGGAERRHLIIMAAPDLTQDDFIAWLDPPEVLPAHIEYQHVDVRIVLLASSSDTALATSRLVNLLAAIDGWLARAGHSDPALCQGAGFVTIECGGAYSSDWFVGHNYIFSSTALGVRTLRFFRGGNFQDDNNRDWVVRTINGQGAAQGVWVFWVRDLNGV